MTYVAILHWFRPRCNPREQSDGFEPNNYEVTTEESKEDSVSGSSITAPLSRKGSLKLNYSKYRDRTEPIKKANNWEPMNRRHVMMCCCQCGGMSCGIRRVMDEKLGRKLVPHCVEN